MKINLYKKPSGWQLEVYDGTEVYEIPLDVFLERI